MHREGIGHGGSTCRRVCGRHPMPSGRTRGAPRVTWSREGPNFCAVTPPPNRLPEGEGDTSCHSRRASRPHRSRQYPCSSVCICGSNCLQVHPQPLTPPADAPARAHRGNTPCTVRAPPAAEARADAFAGNTPCQAVGCAAAPRVAQPREGANSCALTPPPGPLPQGEGDTSCHSQQAARPRRPRPHPLACICVHLRLQVLAGPPAAPDAATRRTHPRASRQHPMHRENDPRHSRTPMPLIYLIAGEASGDILGARLMRAIAARRPDTTFAGIGGEAMAEAGLRTLFPLRDLALMGLLEILPRLRQLRQRLRQTTEDIAARRPDVVVTIDSPGFTLRILRAIAPTQHPPRPLRGAPGLGLARIPRPPLPRPVGPAALPAAVRAGLLRPPQPARHLRRPPGAGERCRPGRRRPLPRPPRHPARGAHPHRDARQPPHGGVAPAADPRRHAAPRCRARAQPAAGRPARRPGRRGRPRGHRRLAGPADPGAPTRTRSTTRSPPRPRR